MSRSVFSKRYARLCELLIEARQQADLTQAELAKALRRPQSFVSKYERGERRLDLIELLEVADSLAADPAKLIRDLQGGAQRRGQQS